MTARPDDIPKRAEFELLQTPALPMTADAILADVTHYFGRMLGRHTVQADSPFLYQAVVLAARDRLMERWSRTRISTADNRRTHYLSLEFLMGRLLRNTLLNLGITEQAGEALHRIGIELEDVCEQERDAGLGNGGLGRLAACFLDSCATLGLPVTGYGLRYRYGMFHQRIKNGYQQEEPDSWLRDGFPWEIERVEFSQKVSFGGRSETFLDRDGNERHAWTDGHDVLAIPYDIPVPGYRNGIVNTLRLWSAAATDEFDLEEFNAGSYADAVAAKNAAENITMVLYPNDATECGKELRLRQQYFLASASLQDSLRSWIERHGENFEQFAEKNCYQLNDTHPAIAVPELMRLLLDRHQLPWDTAWQITSSVMAYTNHTLLPEALEKWPVDLVRRLLPRIMDIIYEINARFLSSVSQRWPGDNERLGRMSLIEEGSVPMVRMAYLAIVGSYSINGVAALHSQLLRDGLFRDFADFWPTKFNNKTNGVTPRRWLASCNPGLAHLITSRIGDGWVKNLDELVQLREFVGDEVFRSDWRAVRTRNKTRLAKEVRRRIGVDVNTQMLFDVQVKRIHEYKRQLLNLLHVIHLYDRIQRGDGSEMPPRAIIIGGKAAPGYAMAKKIVKCINNVASVINSDPQMREYLRLVFFPDYNVSAMEIICPAADLSAQISTAGKEASGTGNMKLMMNGALTIGTLDGANVEILDAVGHDNFFQFGLTVEEVRERRRDYDPAAIVRDDPDFSRVIRLLECGHFNRFEPGIMDAVVQSVMDPADTWMTAADFRSFVEAQQHAGEAFLDQERWTRMSILNTAASGFFSTDRTMQAYNEEIWHLQPVELTPE